MNNLDELNTLGQYSREKDAQHRDVHAINERYDALVKVIDQGQMGAYQDEASWTRSFGDPILKKDLANSNQRWLYRYAINRLAKDKVYVYFDRNGKMIKWERLPCSKFF